MTAIASTRPAPTGQRIGSVMARIFELLKARPNEPVSFEEVGSLIPDTSHGQIVETLLALEGPVPGEGDSQPAYIRCCSRNEKAVYID